MKEKSTYIKIRGYYDNDEQKGGILSKEILALESKIVEVETRLKTVLTKVELEEFKYKELYEKVSADALVYMEYIHRLQEESEQNYKKYLKLYKICRGSKVKMEDEVEEV
jgi:GTP cyclohydrolase FolE2